MKVAVDLEGVLADSHSRFVADVNDFLRYIGSEKRVDAKDISSWDFGNLREEMSEEYERNLGRKMDREIFLWGDEGGPWDGFMEASGTNWKYDGHRIDSYLETPEKFFTTLREELEENCEEVQIDIVTGRVNVGADVLKYWLESVGISESLYENLVQRRDKHELDYSLFFEDKGDRAERIESDGREVVLVDRPWNKGFEVEKRVEEARDYVG